MEGEQIEKSDSPEQYLNQQPRILIVDDDELLRRITTRYLVGEKIDPKLISETESGKKALELLEGDQNFDAIIMDNDMPGGKGIGILPIIRELYPHIFNVFRTGDSFVDEDIDKMLKDKNSGVDLFLSKNSPPEEFAKAIDAIKEHKRKRDAENNTTDAV